MFKTSETQMRIANRVAALINEYDSNANATVENKDGFIIVSGTANCKSWLINVGIRGGLKDLYTKKSVQIYSVKHSYKIW